MDRNANVFKFQGSKMIVSGRGPNVTMDTSFRPNLLSSTMNMPRNFEKQSSAASVVSSQRSIYHGRDTSPTASVHSHLQPRNFHLPFYSRGYYRGSVYNDRAVSPVSMRSIDSTASRADIVIDAIKSCTEDEWEKIWHAVNRKHEFRKKAQKRQKMKMFLKNLRNRSDDEGQQGSHSSISNDDCASTRTGYSRRYRYDPYYKDNIPKSVNSYDCRSQDMYRCSSRDAYSGYYRSDSQNPYQVDNSALNNIMCGPKNTFFSQRYTNGQRNIPSIQKNTLNASICSTKSMQNMPMMSQRDRFRGGFQFPSQKFNRSTLYEEQEQVRNKQFPKNDCANKKKNILNEQSDENDDIFLEKTANPKPVTKTEKRKAESLEDIPNPTKKKLKTTSTSNNDKCKANKQLTHNNVNNETNEFEFVKPQFPARKSAPAKPREKLISKSSGAPDPLCITVDKTPQTQPVQALSTEPELDSELDSEPDPEPEPDPEHETQEIPELTTSDLSMRPSFMKRKLFTQTLDVTERKNNSFDSGSADSPQNNIYSALSREKHKTRKLASGQSLLSHDVNQDDKNLLDLIHKIVPPNQVNSTITANNTKTRVSRTRNDDAKWDITSSISTFNNDSVSETYTDDEIFKTANDDTTSKPQKKSEGQKNKQDDKNKAVNKSVCKKTNNKNGKDGTINPVSNKNVNHINIDSVRNSITRNNNNIKHMDEKKETNNKIIKDVGNVKQAKNKNLKDIDNTKPKNNKNVKDIGKIKLPGDNILKDIGNVNLSNTSRDVSRNALSNKLSKEPNKQMANNKKDKGIEKKVLPAAPKTDTPMKPCPAKRVMLSRSRMDAFWDTDESDYECVGARRDLQPVLQHTDRIQKHISSHKENCPVTRPTSSSKEIATNKNLALSPLVVLCDVQMVPKKQASKKTANKIQQKTLQKPGDTTQPEKLGKIKIGTPNTSLRTRRRDLSATLDSVNNPGLKEGDTSVKQMAPTKTAVQKKQKKTSLDKNNKTKPTLETSKTRNKKQNLSQIVDSNKHVEKLEKQNKKSKVQNSADPVKIEICKVLRSRLIDLSSSFNSDKFELTMSRTRKSRTPSKRISFNKSRDNNKIRNRAVKS